MIGVNVLVGRLLIHDWFVSSRVQLEKEWHQVDELERKLREQIAFTIKRKRDLEEFLLHGEKKLESINEKKKKLLERHRAAKSKHQSAQKTNAAQRNE